MTPIQRILPFVPWDWDNLCRPILSNKQTNVFIIEPHYVASVLVTITRISNLQPFKIAFAAAKRATLSRKTRSSKSIRDGHGKFAYLEPRPELHLDMRSRDCCSPSAQYGSAVIKPFGHGA